MALTKLKIAVLPPMPSASVSTAMAVKPGFFSSWRKANFRSFITQRLHWIDACGTAGGNETGQQGDEQQDDANRCQQEGIVRGQTEELAGEQAIGGKGNDQPNRQSDCCQAYRPKQHQMHKSARARSQGQSDAEFI